MRLRVLCILGIILVSLGAAAVLAWRAGVVAGAQMETQVAANEVRLDGRLLVRLHAHIVNPREASRSHTCDFWASIENGTQHRLLAAHVSLRSRTIELPEITAGKNTDVPIWTIAIPQEQASCAQKARWFQKIAGEAKTSTCVMDGATEGQCRKLVRVVGDFDYTSLRSDDWEADNAAEAVAEVLRQGNLPVGTIVAVPPASFFKLGFSRNDTQKSDSARALAAADAPFNPNNPADINRIDDWPYATMDGPVTVLQVHLDKEQVADWYKVSLWANLLDVPRYEVIAWVPREDLDKARAKQLAAPRKIEAEKPTVATSQDN
jgi:hypothetical protein